MQLREMHANARSVVAVIDYHRLYRTSPVNRRRLIEEGVPVELVRVLATDMQVERRQLANWLVLPKSIGRAGGDGSAALPSGEGERVVGTALLIGHVQAMAARVNAACNAAEWFGRWIARRNPRLGLRPRLLLPTASGRDLISVAVELDLERGGARDSLGT